jgi:hypothetical protein
MLVCVSAFATPPVPPPESYSNVQGSVSEQNDAISQKSTVGWDGLGNQGVAMGNQGSNASFAAYPFTSNGEDSNGSANVAGGILVYNYTGTYLVVSLATGFTSGAADVNESAKGAYPMTLNINGALSLYSAGQIVNSANDSGITNGAAGQATANGAYQIGVSQVGDNYSGWEGSGSVKGYTFNLVTATPSGNGYGVFSAASINSVACPVGK